MHAEEFFFFCFQKDEDIFTYHITLSYKREKKEPKSRKPGKIKIEEAESHTDSWLLRRRTRWRKR
jgi:hypothetical protein